MVNFEGLFDFVELVPKNLKMSRNKGFMVYLVQTVQSQIDCFKVNAVLGAYFNELF